MRTQVLLRLVAPCLLLTLGCASMPGMASGPESASAGEVGLSSDFADEVEGMSHRAGLLDVYVEETSGRVLLELPAPDAGGLVGSYLYIEGLTTGLGSNPVGLDRGQLGDARLINVRRLGNRVLFQQPNLDYRALTDDGAEARATRQAFATSVLWAAEVQAVAGDGRSLVDITSFLVRDAHGVAQRLAQTEQGKYQLDLKRSVVDPSACLAFPDNLEFEALLTFEGEPKGRFVRQTAPTAEAVTLVQHHSLVRLPDAGYTPRRFDPRMGSFEISFLDYAAPLDQDIRQQWVVRHRLERTDPSAPSSPAKDPIIYYVDPGTPEPIRSALVEGAAWWAEAFEAAGFEDAFKVEILPADAHPLDVRYNVIQWVHRSTRGWSYGGGVVDPRTGEMIKGHVSLGSLRIRQDILLFEGLAGVEKTGSGAPDDPIEIALARIRQLSAHEVGHTLGFNHNFAASTYGRASVMDYPAPWIRVDDAGGLDFSAAYAVGAGAWDIASTNYAYREFAPGADEAAGLEAIVQDALNRNLFFLSDADARPAGAASPRAGLWDNGEDPVAALEEVLAVRRIGLDQFGEDNLAAGRPLALLEEVLAPLYFHHRYQLAVTSKVLGGVDYHYKVRGDSQPLPQPVATAQQRAALKALLVALAPETLALPANVLAVMHPRDVGSGRNRELFRGRSSVTFDPVAAAATAADFAVGSVLQPERLNRVAAFAAGDTERLTVNEIIEAVVATAFADSGATLAPVASAIQEVVVEHLASLAGSERASVEVRESSERALESLSQQAQGDAPSYLARRARRTLERAVSIESEPASAPELPPGDPIGSPALANCSWQHTGGI